MINYVNVALFSLFCLFCKQISIGHRDDSLIIVNGIKEGIYLSSLNSSQKIKIAKTYVIGDTLFVIYKRGVFISSDSRLNIDKEIKYMKCADRMYEIKNMETGIQLTEISKVK